VTGYKNLKTDLELLTMKKVNVLSKAEMKNVLGGKGKDICSSFEYAAAFNYKNPFLFLMNK
jgi:hypothetical protein